MTTLLLVPLSLYASLLLLLFVFQTRLLFPAGAVGRAGPLPPGAGRLEIAASTDGDRLHGVHLAPRVENRDPRTLILAFGGNAWNAEAAASYLHDLFPEAHVVAFHYRGYRPSTGSPSAAALLADAPIVQRAALERVKPDRAIAVGFSIGSGVAASLAGRPGLDGLILVTPFDSLAAVAAGHYRWLPVRLLFRHEMEPAAALRGSPVPVALIAGARDTLIPPARTAALRASGATIVFDRTLPDAGHNDIYDRPHFRAAMREALGSVTSR